MTTSGNLKEKIKFFVMKEPSITEFFKGANLNNGRYKCIGDILAKYRNGQKLDFTPEEQNMLNNKRSGRGKPIGKKLSTTEMFKIFGEKCLEMDLSDSNTKKLKLHRYLESCGKYRISYSSITDEDIRLSISGFVDLVYETNDGDQIDYIDKLIEIIENKGHVDETTMDDKFNHDKLPRYIAKHFFNLTDENFWKEIANSATRNGNQISFPEVQQRINDSNTDYADIVKIIGMMLIEQKHLPEEERQNYKAMAGFLTVSRHLRNCKDHVGEGMSKEKTRLIVACFLLYTLIGLYLMLTKNLKEWGRVDSKRDKTDDIKTLCVYYGCNDNYSDVEVPIKLVKIEPKGKEYVEPEVCRRGCKEYTIFKWCKYQIEIGGTFDVPDDKLWGTLSDHPVVMWSGVKPHFFGSMWAVSGEFRHYVETDIQGKITDNTGAIKDNTKKVSKCQESISELSEILKILTRIIGSDDESVEKPQTLIGSLKDLRDLIKVSQDNLTDIVAKLLEVIENEKKQKRKRKFERTRWGIDILVVFVCLSWLLYNIFDINHNLTYLNRFWLYLLFMVVPIVAGLLLWKTHVAYSDYSNTSPRIIDAGMVALSLIFVIGAFFPNKGPESFFATYDFAATHAAGDNIKVAQLMEDYLATNPANDENVRTQLGRYYLTYVNDKERAYEIIRPMIDNLEKYRDGNDIIAEILFAQGNYNKVIEDYIEKSRDKPSPVINRLEGIKCVFVDRGVDQNLKRGDSLLLQAARMGDVEALYWLGIIRSTSMIQRITKNTQVYYVPDIKYDLIEAIDFYRQAVKRNHPKAAIDLGNLYSDLNMNDSAKFYYERAIALAEKENWKEANYRMGLLYDKLKITSNKYMDAVKDIYPPAILYKAIRSKNHTRAIEYFNNLRGGYMKGEGYHRYIHPIVFEYILRNDENQHDMENALDTLLATRPKGYFNIAFVKGMEYLLSTDSSTWKHGMDYMKKSAEDGCLYAKMLCIFEEWKTIINEYDYEKKDKIRIFHKELEDIGKEIPFAYILLAWLARDMIPFGIENLNASDVYAENAIKQGHPAGSLLLGYVPYNSFIGEMSKLVNNYGSFDESFKDSWNEIDIKRILRRRSSLEMSMRSGGLNYFMKSDCFSLGFVADRILEPIMEDDRYLTYIHGNDNAKLRFIFPRYPVERLHFWSDVAMANHSYPAECQILMYYRRLLKVVKDNTYDLQYRLKLISAALTDFPYGESTLKNEDIQWEMNFISLLLKDIPSEYKESLRNEFRGNVVATTILNLQEAPTEYTFTQAYDYPFYQDFLNNVDYYRGLLSEFSEITDGLMTFILGKMENE